jgi:hypothetical protein
MITRLALLFVATAAPHAASGQTTHFDVSVGQYSSGVISPTKVDEVLAATQAVFVAVSGPGDVSCDVAFARSGGVAVTSAAVGEILSFPLGDIPAGFPTIMIFKAITTCGDSSVPDGFSIAGCARPNGPVAVIRHSAESVIWAHELGHSQGLSHHPDLTNFMYKQAALGHDFVTSGQCQAFRSGQDTPILVETPSVTVHIDELLAQIWIEGPPVDAIMALSPADIDVARRVLQGEEFHKWANALTILGLRGSSDDIPIFQKILDFPNPFPEDDGIDPVTEAKKTLPFALAYFAITTNNSEAVNILGDLSDSTSNANRISNVGPPDSANANAASEVIRLNATIGLAMAAPLVEGAAGRLENANAVLVAQDQGAAVIDPFAIEPGPFVDGLAELSAMVKEKGLLAVLSAQSDPN